ncbi:RDD family protein [Halomonas urumqiensis]|uniref:RDD family protein n=1 Tax=Halomonas urumqiensis TaxID=1684789 RepID=A0A2N7UEY1_9GAMM|nr:RDD family protein [Halomonas urumqiensis]PMR78987.1 RDD family protein [Halomonas urumqiensis]PTB00980.1 RDD family protein [Halomonas urumqiensis]GHE22924.1 RDD family protein [Halomonas urumqiensis]
MQRRFGNLDDVWPAGLARRVGAMIYDAFLVVAIWILFTGLHLLFVRHVLGIPAEQVAVGAAQVLSLRLLLFVAAFTFFAFFWTRGGMTLGMQAWRLRVQTIDGYTITLMQSLIRYLVAWLSVAAFGLGYLWILFDSERRSWPDIVSGTRVVVLPKPRKNSPR